jgi:hypothetical protein
MNISQKDLFVNIIYLYVVYCRVFVINNILISIKEGEN